MSSSETRKIPRSTPKRSPVHLQLSDTAPRAVLDIGSNSIRLLVARGTHHGLETMLDKSRFVRLGHGLHAKRRLQSDKVESAISAMDELLSKATPLSRDAIVAVATSAVRDAGNGQSFVRQVRKRLGLNVQILSGVQEAKLAFLGATNGISLHEAAVVADVGGGSAEIVHGTPKRVSWAYSLRLGCGRLSDQFLRSDPAGPREIEALVKHVDRRLATLPRTQASTLILTGGTSKTVGRLLDQEGPFKFVTERELVSVLSMLLSLPIREIADRFDIKQARAEVLAAGVATLLSIVYRRQPERIIITRHGLREGVLLASFRRRGQLKLAA